MTTRHCWRCAAVLGAVPPTTCARCGEVHYLNPKPCGVAVVLRERRVLMLLRAREPQAGAWTVPGGFCDAAEHPMHATERELEEELGLRGRAVAYLGTWMDTYGEADPDGLIIHTAVSGYLTELDDPGAPLRPAPDEAAEAHWFDLSELPRNIAFPAHVGPMIDVAAGLVAAGSGRRPLPDRTW